MLQSITSKAVIKTLLPIVIVPVVLYNIYNQLDGENKIQLQMTEYLSEVSEVSEEALFMEEMEKRMAKRKETLKNFCLNYATSEDNLHTKKVSMYSSKSSKLTFCIPPKTGSMSIKKFLFQIENDVDTLEKLASVGHGKFNLQQNEELVQKASRNFGHTVTGSSWDSSNRRTVLVARHAFSRLVSGYWSKIGPREHSNPFFDPITQKIAKNYRGYNYLKAQGDDRFATFSEFVDYISTHPNDPDSNEPHWMPIESYCNPCIIPYDVIIQTETLSDDIRYLAKLENLQNITIPPAYSYTKTKDAMKSACENLSEKTMLQALWKYKMDFAMLGYDPFPCLLAKYAV